MRLAECSGGERCYVISVQWTIRMSYIAASHEIVNEAEVCKKGEIVSIFCRLHCSLHSQTSLSTSVTIGDLTPRIFFENGPW